MEANFGFILAYQIDQPRFYMKIVVCQIFRRYFSTKTDAQNDNFNDCSNFEYFSTSDNAKQNNTSNNHLIQVHKKPKSLAYRQAN